MPSWLPETGMLDHRTHAVRSYLCLLLKAGHCLGLRTVVHIRMYRTGRGMHGRSGVRILHVMTVKLRRTPRTMVWLDSRMPRSMLWSMALRLRPLEMRRVLLMLLLWRPIVRARMWTRNWRLSVSLEHLDISAGAVLGDVLALGPLWMGAVGRRDAVSISVLFPGIAGIRLRQLFDDVNVPFEVHWLHRRSLIVEEAGDWGLPRRLLFGS